MAVSGSQKTRVGASLSGVGKKLAISPKSPSVGGSINILDLERGLTRGMMRGIARGMS
jgi:hypothetical protein